MSDCRRLRGRKDLREGLRVFAINEKRPTHTRDQA